MEYSTISRYLKSIPISSAVNLLTAVIVLEGRYRFGALYDELSHDADKVRGNQKFTKAELANWASSQDIRKGIQRVKFEVKKRDLLTKPRRLKSNEFQILQHLLVLSFYSEFHFRSDLPSIKLGHHKGQNMFKNGVIYLYDFKTAKKFQERGLLPLTYRPGRALATLLRKFIYIRSLQPEITHSYLIVNKSWGPVKRHSFYQYMSSLTYRYIGKRLGTSMFRHIYVTEFLAKGPSLEERKKFMYGMQQLSLETQESYKRVREPDESDDESGLSEE